MHYSSWMHTQKSGSDLTVLGKIGCVSWPLLLCITAWYFGSHFLLWLYKLQDEAEVARAWPHILATIHYHSAEGKHKHIEEGQGYFHWIVSLRASQCVSPCCWPVCQYRRQKNTALILQMQCTTCTEGTSQRCVALILSWWSQVNLLKVNCTVNSKRCGVLFVTDGSQGEILMRLLFGEEEGEANVLWDPALKRELRRREAPN